MSDSNKYKTDEIFRRGMENLPIENPSSSDWKKLRGRMQNEGILKKDKRRFFLYFSLILLAVVGIVGIYFKNNDSEKTSTNKNISENTKINNIKQKEEIVENKIIIAEEKKNVVLDNSSELFVEKKIVIKNESRAIENKKPEIPKKPVTENAEVKTSELVVLAQKDEKQRVEQNLLVNEKTNPTAVNNIQSEIKVEQNPIAQDSVVSAEKIIPEEPKKADSLQVAAKIDSSEKVVKAESNYKNDSAYYEPKSPKWGIGLYFSPDKNLFHLKPTNADGEKILSRMNNLPPDTFADKKVQYTVGLTVHRYLTERISIETGFLFSQKKNVNERESIGDGIRNYTFRFSGRYLMVPLTMKYSFYQTKRIKLYLNSGILATLNFPKDGSDFFKREVVTFTDSSSTLSGEKIYLKPFSMGIAGKIGAGCDFKLTRNWHFYFEPNYQYHFTPVIKHPTYKEIPVEHYIRTFSLAVGLFYDF